MSNTTHPTNLSTLMSRLPLPTEWIQQTHLVQRWGTVRRVWPRALHVDLVQINKSKVIINLILVLFGADKIVCLSLPMVSKRHPPLSEIMPKHDEDMGSIGEKIAADSWG